MKGLLKPTSPFSTPNTYGHNNINQTYSQRFKEPDIRNPTVSSSYRSCLYSKPNQIVLEAQTRVCTGPTQTKPLNEEQAFKVFDTILRSAKGELKDEEKVSKAQLGAFFAAMTIRANAFPEPTQWSEGERRAINAYWPHLVRVLSPDIIFVADPEGSIMGMGNSIGPQYVGNGTSDMRLVGALREVLAGGHLGYEEVQGVLRDVLPLNSENTSATVTESLLSAFLIGQRMNRESDRELKAYCLAFDNELGPVPIADVRSLTHYGEPYDGNTRFFRSTLFVAAVRSCSDEACLLHGVDWMPPKGGITEEQMLKFMGADTNLSPLQAKRLLEDKGVGFAYVSQREACPSLYSVIGLREHIKKRPPLATTEKVQQIVRARGKEAMIAGFYHEGYEEPLLMLMKRRGVHSGLVVKGEEGALSMTTKARSVNASKGLPVNYCAGFRSLDMPMPYEVDGVSLENFKFVVNAEEYGLDPTETPRTDKMVSRNIELGLAALRGEKGPAYDRIILNAGIVDHLLGCDGAENISAALDRAREAIDSGKALDRLLNYIKMSHKV
ncbi:Pyrimidine-nucleoside phosphorylase, bacterial/eukaryotic [Heracleum sosnowskyi]|uniref:Pyrimidine-nucleoside phosphorylase, bacterial/eukaryotic n=1 Tax=Heracleum sosnowskyi TaxID=360622 RepID=A0AAD8I141_9APIA|nr:Pyrimidine-nucleoside phosphorylase, bacterial/eukaryotic [Heracleum sosnowskyi]